MLLGCRWGAPSGVGRRTAGNEGPAGGAAGQEMVVEVPGRRRAAGPALDAGDSPGMAVSKGRAAVSGSEVRIRLGLCRNM